MSSQPIYQLRPSEVFASLESSPTGLTADEVERRRLLYGRNLLVVEAPASTWRRFIGYISYPMALLLWVAGGVAFALGEPGLGLVVWILVLANGGFGFWREHRTQQAMQALHNLLPSYARLVRAGQEVQVTTDEIVPGDLLVLAEGDNIPADARVVEEYGLRVNNATLTGEAVPARKSADASFREGISELERPNLVFAGTSVFSGTGRAVVYATGMLTQFGRLAHLTQAVHEEPSPLQAEMARLTHRISLVVLGLGTVVFVVGAFQVGMELFEAFLLAIGIIVAAIPEGLPATLTLSLAIAGQRLAQRGVLVKKLSVIETLGNVSTICADKSGTLTQNQMTVREIWVARQRLAVSGVGYEPVGEFSLLAPLLSLPASLARGEGSALIPASPLKKGVAGKFQGDLQAMLAAGMLCNNARLTPPSPERPYWSSLGDQTEAALLVAAMKSGLHEDELTRHYLRVHELPFDARRKRMTTIHRDFKAPDARAWQPAASRSPRRELAFVKGAPREVLQLCTHILIDGEEQPLTEDLRLEVLAANDDFARRALRVLALARRTLPPRNGTPSAADRGSDAQSRRYRMEDVERDLTFLGLAAMHDPPRPEVAAAMQTLRQAGIRMIMVTGDYGLTAESMARRVGMLSTPNPLIVTGAELDDMDDIKFRAALSGETIFARMAPEHKLHLVAALQQAGEVVAVTGDGVNDAPALRKADVGVVMGISGTDVAKEAADIVLTNDNFATIVNAVEEGRAIYDNIRKFITYIFSSNVPEIMPFMLTALAGFPLALTVKQILAIDLGTDMLPALALGTEQPEPDVMQRLPRRRGRPIIDRRLVLRSFFWLGMIEAALCYTGFFLVYLLAGQADALGAAGWLANYLPDSWAGALVIPDTLVYLMAVTVFHAGVVMAQVGNAFACRSTLHRSRALGWFSNRFLLVGIAVEILIILALIYIPPLARMFDHVPLPPHIWLWLGMYPLVLYGLEWIRKGITRRLRRLRESGNQVTI